MPSGRTGRLQETPPCAEHRGRSTRSEWPRNPKRNHPLPRLMDTSRVDGVKASLYNGTPRSHVARGCPARDGPSCSPTGARARRAGRAGLLSQDRLLRSGVVGPRGRALLLSGVMSGGPRLRPRVGRLAGRGGAFLSERSCRSVGRASVLARLFSGFCGVRATCL
jgi:hypothetical protein